MNEHIGPHASEAGYFWCSDCVERIKCSSNCDHPETIDGYHFAQAKNKATQALSTSTSSVSGADTKPSGTLNH